MIHTLVATVRTPGKPEDTRTEGNIPGILYGPDITPVPFAIPYRIFDKLYRDVGDSTLIDLKVGDAEPVTVLVQDVQYDPVKGQLTHVDFRQVQMNQEMEVEIALNFVGEAPAVKALGGTLVKAHDFILVKCLPKDLVGHIDIDVSVISTFDDHITAGSIALPSGMTLVDDPNNAIVTVQAPLSEDELKAMEESQVGDVAEVAVEEKGKAPAEGEAGAEPEKKKE